MPQANRLFTAYHASTTLTSLGDETFFADILAGIGFNASFAGAKLALPLLLEFFLLRFCPDRSA